MLTMLPLDTLDPATDQNFIGSITECNQAFRIINNGSGGNRKQALYINAAARLCNILRNSFSNYDEWIKISCAILLQNARIMHGLVQNIHATNPSQQTTNIINDLNNHISCLEDNVNNANKVWYKDWRVYACGGLALASVIGAKCAYDKWNANESAEPIYRAGGYSSLNDIGELGILSAATSAGAFFGKKFTDRDQENLERHWQQHLAYIKNSTLCEDGLSELLKKLQAPLKDDLTEVLNEIAQDQNPDDDSGRMKEPEVQTPGVRCAK